MNELVDLVSAAASVNAYSFGLTASNNYYGGTADYSASTWPTSTYSNDILVV